MSVLLKSSLMQTRVPLYHIYANSFPLTHEWEYHEILLLLQESEKLVRVGKTVSFLYDPAVAQSKIENVPRVFKVKS